MTEGTVDSDVKIIDLNPKCLIQVLNKLNYPDLMSVKKAHAAFGDTVESVCTTNRFQFIVNIRDGSDSLINIKLIDDFLLHFGDKIQKSAFLINCNSHTADYEMILKHSNDLIAKRCAFSNIDFCLLSGFRLDQLFFKENENFFKSLETFVFQLQNKPIEKYIWLFDFLPEATKIKDFDIAFLNDKHDPNVVNINLLSKISSSQLEKCSVTTCTKINDTSTDVLDNHTIKHLFLKGVSFNPVFWEKFPNVEEIYYAELILTLSPSILNLDKLQHLSLEGHVEFPMFNEFLAKLAEKDTLKTLKLVICLTSMEYIHLKDTGQLPTAEVEMVNHLSKMSNLEKLCLETKLRLQCHLLKIGRSLINLKTFSFCYENDDDADGDEDSEQSFSMGLDFVTEAKSLTHLSLYPFPVFHKRHEFYNQLVDIRRKMEHKDILFVYMPRGVQTSIEQEKFVRGKLY